MPVLLTSSDGGRCDARCYNAHGGDCNCCCGGMNHGRGLERAMQNVRVLIAGQVEVPEEIKQQLNQGSLFE